ncbi:hypothetical protein EDB92DRAFT_1946508 [Lactarius akahatsu]|uniref:Uncharacterized protein n=1 Tax=Lactarius akahatsu TaxID=416441 RepID=A0AAD4QD66_9AGAM|nr:hypothetical protein EDB92DRAFT_1946508 [Lactarius akahatsu]
MLPRRLWTSLHTWLTDEALYAVAIQEQLELFKKWGPRERYRQPYPHRVQRVGINCESSFESTLLKRGPGCEVWGYDYRVNSVRTLSSLPLPYLLNWICGQWGPEITGDPEVRDRAHFKPFALGGTNNHEDHDNPKCWTLDSLMDLNCASTSRGGEFDGLTTFLSAHAAAAAAEGDVLPVGQLQLEIYAREGRENLEYLARWWASLEAAGLRPFWTEPNLVYINLVRGVRPELAEVCRLKVRGLSGD